MIGVCQVYLANPAYVGAYGNLIIRYALSCPYASNLLGAFALHLEDPHLVGVGNGQTFARVAIAVFLYQFTHQSDSLAGGSATLQRYTCQFLYHEHTSLVLHSVTATIGGFANAQLMLIQARVGGIQEAVGVLSLRNGSLLLHIGSVIGMLGMHGSLIDAHDSIARIILSRNYVHPGAVP